MGRGDGKKYRVKWTNLSIPCEIDYEAGHNVLKDPCLVRPEKQQKIVGLESAPSKAGLSVASLNGIDDVTNRVALDTSAAGVGAKVVDNKKVANKSSRASKASAASLPNDLPHALFSARAMKLGGAGGEGRCRICLDKHASGICKTCSTGLDTPNPKLFWLCYPGSHGRHCYCKHMHEMLQSK